MVVGIAELAGELGVILFTDRFGKGRSLVVGVFFAGLFYLAVPVLGHSLPLTLLGLGLLFFTFEFAVVSNIALLSELVPDKRNTMMAAFFATATAGRASGALVGPRLWTATENLVIHGIVSVLAMAGVFLLGVLVVTKRRD
jgi:predicted MFS family arabinose efflux permease